MMNHFVLVFILLLISWVSPEPIAAAQSEKSTAGIKNQDSLEKEVPSNLRTKQALSRLRTRYVKPGSSWAVSPAKLVDYEYGFTGYGISGIFPSGIGVKILKRQIDRPTSPTREARPPVALVRIFDDRAGAYNGLLVYVWEQSIEGGLPEAGDKVAEYITDLIQDGIYAKKGEASLTTPQGLIKIFTYDNSETSSNGGRDAKVAVSMPNGKFYLLDGIYLSSLSYSPETIQYSGKPAVKINSHSYYRGEIGEITTIIHTKGKELHYTQTIKHYEDGAPETILSETKKTGKLKLIPVP